MDQRISLLRWVSGDVATYSHAIFEGRTLFLASIAVRELIGITGYETIDAQSFAAWGADSLKYVVQTFFVSLCQFHAIKSLQVFDLTICLDMIIAMQTQPQSPQTTRAL